MASACIIHHKTAKCHSLRVSATVHLITYDRVPDQSRVLFGIISKSLGSQNSDAQNTALIGCWNGYLDGYDPPLHIIRQADEA